MSLINFSESVSDVYLKRPGTYEYFFQQTNLFRIFVLKPFLKFKSLLKILDNGFR